MRILFSVLTALLFLLLSSCEDPVDETTDISINFNAKFQGGDFVMNNVYSDPLSNDIRFATFKFYVSDMMLVTSNNVKVEVTDIDLVDFMNSGTYSIQSEIDNAIYTSIEFGLGVSADLNQLDPSQFPNEHPLSAFTNTFWNWSSKYRFALIEGDIDTTGANLFPTGFVYHTGLDTLYRNLSIPISLTAAGGSESVELSVETSDIFFRSGEEIDYIDENVTHTTTNLPLAIRVTDNLANSIN